MRKLIIEAVLADRPEDFALNAYAEIGSDRIPVLMTDDAYRRILDCLALNTVHGEPILIGEHLS